MTARARDAGKVLDMVARSRRQKKALESLEQDNFQEEPHADLGKHCKCSETNEPGKLM